MSDDTLPPLVSVGRGPMSALNPRQVAVAFGSILRAARTDCGMTQEELAERANLDRTYPSLLERGLRQPTIGRLIGIAYALGVKPGALVTRTFAWLRGQVPY